MGGGTVQVVVQLLHVLPVVPLQSGTIIQHHLLMIQPDLQIIKFDLRMMKNDVQYQHTFPFMIIETDDQRESNVYSHYPSPKLNAN